jgi:large subunit ribosomal protein L25
MKEKINVEVPLNFINEAKTVKEMGGILIKSLETVEVNCLPGDLVDKIDVDLSVLNDFSDNIKISDLNLPDSFEVIGHTDTVVATTVEPKISTEAEEEAEAEAEAEKEGDGEKEDKKEDKEDKADEKKEK